MTTNQSPSSCRPLDQRLTGLACRPRGFSSSAQILWPVNFVVERDVMALGSRISLREGRAGVFRAAIGRSYLLVTLLLLFGTSGYLRSTPKATFDCRPLSVRVLARSEFANGCSPIKALVAPRSLTPSGLSQGSVDSTVVDSRFPGSFRHLQVGESSNRIHHPTV